MSPFIERTGSRDLTLSAFHRLLPHWCIAIDIDFVEFCYWCRKPLAVIEAVTGDGEKSTAFVKEFGLMAGLPVYLVRWHRDETNAGIGHVWVRSELPSRQWIIQKGNALQLYDWFVSLHDNCECRK